MGHIYIVTTALKAWEETKIRAQQIARQLQFKYEERSNLSLLKLHERCFYHMALVVGNKETLLVNEREEQHAFHLSMAHLRILKLKEQKEDYLLKAVGQEPLHSFLDCTLGLAGDSIVVSYAHPEIKRLIGIEAVPGLAYVTNEGLRHFLHEDPSITLALRRIQVRIAHYMDYLQRQKDNSFDIVYFDPMFRQPVLESPQFTPLREYTFHEELSTEAFREAIRVAKRKVIVKERNFSGLFEKLGTHYEVGGKYSRIRYGVFEKNE